MRVALLVVLCGCDALFGLHEIDGPRTVTGTLVHRYMNLDAAFAPRLEQVAFAADEQPLTAFHENGAPIDVTWTAASGAFTFDALPGETYRVVADVGGLPQEYQASSEQLALVVTDLGHPDEVAADPGAEIDFQLPAVISGAPIAQTSGVWATGTTVLPTDVTTLPQPMSGLAPAFRQRLALPRAAMHDRVHLLVYSGPMLLDVGTANVDIAAGAPTQVPIDVVTPSVQDCAIFVLHHRQDIDRLASTYPEFPTASSSLSFVAVPRPELGLVAGTSLDSLDPGCVTNPGDCNENPTAQYFIPDAFASYGVVAVSAIVRQRDADGMALAAFIHHYSLLTPQAMCGQSTLDPDDAVLPLAPRLAHVALTTDHTVIGIDPTAPVELTFDTDREVPGTSYHLVLQKLDSGSLTTIRTFFATTPRLLIDPDLLDAGASYVLQITAFSGLPTAGDGDFGDVQYPYSFADVMTPIFSVSK